MADLNNKKDIKKEFNRIWQYRRSIFMGFIISFLVYGAIWLCVGKQNMEKSVRQTYDTVMEKWEEEDATWLAQTFNTSEESFYVDTGLNQKLIDETFDKIVHDKNACKIKDIAFTRNENGQVQAKVRVIIETYDSMKIMKQFLEGMVNDKTTVTHQYSQKEFIQKHAEKLQKDIKGYKKDFMDVQYLLMTLNNETKQWELDWNAYEENVKGEKVYFNKEFFNSVSGNMMKYSQELQKSI